jgi:hypothetical protein
MIDRQQMLIKVAKQDKSASLVATVVLADRMTKVARKEAIRGFVAAKAMNKKADFSSFLNQAWDNAKNWWANDANKAGLAGGALGALGTYGLTGLVPGLKNNTALRLALSGAGGYAGLKGGQAAWNTALSRGNAVGQEAQKKLDDEELKNRESEWNAERTRLNEGITAAEDKGKADVAAAKAQGAKALDAANAAAAKERAAFGEERTRLQTAIDAAKEREKELTDAGAAENAKYVAQAKAQEQLRRQESQKLVNAEFNKKLTNHLQELLKSGKPLAPEVAKQQIDALTQRLAFTSNPEQQQLLRNAIAILQKNTAAPVQAPATFTFGGK